MKCSSKPSEDESIILVDVQIFIGIMQKKKQNKKIQQNSSCFILLNMSHGHFDMSEIFCNSLFISDGTHLFSYILTMALK